jgi:hypothetical protein
VGEMSLSDVIALCSLGSTVVAIIAAPVIALWIGGKLQARANIRQQQLSLLGVMLSLRHQPFSAENFRALNLIDAVFVDDANVREAWSKYYSALNDPNLQNLPGYTIREEKRRDLLTAIIRSLGLQNKLSTSDLLRAYAPAAVVEAETLAVWERIKRREDLRAEFITRGIGFPDFVPLYYPPQPQPPQQVTPQPGAATSSVLGTDQSSPHTTMQASDTSKNSG